MSRLDVPIATWQSAVMRKAEFTLTTEELAYLGTMLRIVATGNVEDTPPKVQKLIKSLTEKLENPKPAGRLWPLSFSQSALWIVLLVINLIAIGMRVV
ncbi:MAG TPA: hypothetical protein DDW52_10630 [Planctomycetaceae bacterium]|nr:hypothetical protein [Planctomycetaceae bacterium]